MGVIVKSGGHGYVPQPAQADGFEEFIREIQFETATHLPPRLPHDRNTRQDNGIVRLTGGKTIGLSLLQAFIVVQKGPKRACAAGELHRLVPVENLWKTGETLRQAAFSASVMQLIGPQEGVSRNGDVFDSDTDISLTAA